MFHGLLAGNVGQAPPLGRCGGRGRRGGRGGGRGGLDRGRGGLDRRRGGPGRGGRALGRGGGRAGAGLAGVHGADQERRPHRHGCDATTGHAWPESHEPTIGTIRATILSPNAPTAPPRWRRRSCSGGEARTRDKLINSQLLYQLSYPGDAASRSQIDRSPASEPSNDSSASIMPITARWVREHEYVTARQPIGCLLRRMLGSATARYGCVNWVIGIRSDQTRRRWPRRGRDPGGGRA